MLEYSDQSAIVAQRTDGLGARLCAMMNAIWLSEYLGVDFRFSWDVKFSEDLAHGIAPVEKMFSRSFIDRFYCEGLNGLTTWKLGVVPKRETLEALLEKNVIIEAPRTHLGTHLKNYTDDDFKAGLKKAFDRIEFSEGIRNAIALARQTEVPEAAVALHLRSGDIVFGKFRKQPRYSYKGITVPIAKKLIKNLREKDVDVYLFGQDSEQLEYLSQSPNVVNGLTLNREALDQMDRCQKAVYDMVLLSRFQTIVAGTSDFARQASWIGGSDVVTPRSLLCVTSQYGASIRDLDENGGTYHPLQTAYAYWYAYHCGRQARDTELNIWTLKKALSYDPTNEMFYIVLSALLETAGEIDESFSVLDEIFRRLHAKDSLIEIIRVFVVSKPDGSFNLEEYFASFARNAERGSTASAALMFFLARSRSDRKALNYYASLTERNAKRISGQVESQDTYIVKFVDKRVRYLKKVGKL